MSEDIPDTAKPSIPIEKLQALVDEWRKEAMLWREAGFAGDLSNEHFADQLQALIKEAKE